MRFTGFIGPSYTLRSVNVDCQRCVNLYPELDELGTGKEREVAALVPTPGLSLLTTFTNGPVRGTFKASNGILYVVAYNKVYSLTSAWVKTELGTLSTFAGRVSMADSGERLAIVDGSTTGFMWNFQALTSAEIGFPTDVNSKAFTGCDHVAFQDGYFIYTQKGTNQFFISGLLGSVVADETTIDALDFSQIYGLPGNIVSQISASHNLWMFGLESAQVFFNSGDADFPFQQVNGAHVEIGCAAKHSVCRLGGAVVWLGRDKEGGTGIFRANGYQPDRISTHAIELAVSGYGDVSDSTAYTYLENGHYFYVINFPSADTSWAFDSSTSLWHERCYTIEGQFERHRADCHAFAYDTHVVGDFENGNLYKLDSNVYTDNGAAITRMRAAPHISDGNKLIRHMSFELDAETGTGLDGIAQGTDPQVMLQWSNDGGHAWSDEQWTSLGKIGNTRQRTRWLRLGMARSRVYRLKITDPVKVVLLGAELGLMKGAS